jgi:hypothetical protein
LRFDIRSHSRTFTIGAGIERSLTVRQLRHSLDRQPPTISAARVQRRHTIAGPSEDRFELRASRAGIRSACRAKLAQAMRRLSLDASLTRGRSKGVPERVFLKRLAGRAGDECKITAWSCG